MTYRIVQASVISLLLLLSTFILCIYSQGIEDEEDVEDELQRNATRDEDLLRRIKAADIKAWMNVSEDPCNDFYNFVCGNWPRINSAQMVDDFVVTKFNQSFSAMDKRINVLLNNLKTGDPIEDKISYFYESCQSIGKSDWNYRAALKKFYDVFGRFSFALKSGRRKGIKVYSWWIKVAHLNKMYGLNYLLDIARQCDLIACNRTLVYLGKPQPGLAEAERYQMSNGLQKFFNASAEEAEQVVKDVYELQNTLMAAGSDEYLKTAQNLRDIYTLYNISDLQEKYKDYYDLQSLLRISLNISEYELQQVYVKNDGYLDRLGEIMNNTDSQIVDDYILWLQLKDYVVDADTLDMDAFCVNVTRRYFGPYIERAVYEEFRSEEFETQIYTIWNGTKEVFLNQLQSKKYDWMTRWMREHAANKLKNMTFQINSYDDQNFLLFYKGLKIDATNYVMNLHNTLKRLESWRRYKFWLSPESVKDDSDAMYAPVYYLRQNQVRIPTALLQPFHIWHRQYPKAILYGAIGTLMAHEMLHAFDEVGRHYDANGNVNNWWDDQAVELFEEKRCCFQIQYSNYTFGDYPLANSTIQKEVIADNAGLRIAYAAYNRWLENEQRLISNLAGNETLKSLPYNHLQLFFISYGQHWCEDVKPEYVESYAANEPYPPARNRLIGAISNFDIFSTVFRCTSLSPMYSNAKCEIY